MHRVLSTVTRLGICTRLTYPIIPSTKLLQTYIIVALVTTSFEEFVQLSKLFQLNEYALFFLPSDFRSVDAKVFVLSFYVT